MDILNFISVQLWDVGLYISAILGLIGALILRRLLKYRGYKLPPGPPGYPLIGNMYDLNGKKKHETLAEMSKTYGPVVSVYLGSQLFVALNNFDVVTEACVQRKNDFSGRPKSVSTDLGTGGGKTIAFNDGPIWALQRKLTMKGLRPLVASKSIETRIHDSATKVFTVLRQKKEAVDPEPYVAQIVTHALCGICFGTSYKLDDTEFDEFLHSMKLLGDSGEGGVFLDDIIPILRYCPTPKLRRFLEQLTDFHRLVRRKVDEHQLTFNPDKIKDFTDSMLLSKQNVEPENGNDDRTTFCDLTNEHIMFAIADTFGAGVDTTKNSINFALRYMAAYPEIQKKVQEEVDRVVDFEGKDRLPGASDRESLPYTDAVICETLRRHPAGPLAIPHRAVCKTSVGGYDIPEDTAVWINIWALHHDPAYWDKPHEFIPDRFLNANGQMLPKPKSYMPFGIGKRLCIGQALAKSELVLLLACFLQKFTVHAPGTGKLDMGEQVGVLVMRPTPFKLVFSER